MEHLPEWLRNPLPPPIRETVVPDEEGWLITCHACGLSVTEQDAENKQAVSVLGRIYHRDHVNCQRCQTNCADAFYRNPSSGNPMCADCFAKLVNPACPGCDRPVPTLAVRLKKAFWHRCCIKCTLCSNVIAGRAYELVGEFYDEDCARIVLHGVKIFSNTDSLATSGL